MEFRDWDPGNQWRSGDYGWLRRFSSNGIEGSRQIGDAYQSDIGKILVRTIQRWMFMVFQFGLRNIRFRGSYFKESDDGIVWIVRWISFNSRSQESSGIILDRITKGILFFYARMGTNRYGFDWIRVQCEVKILGIIWIQGDNHGFITDRFGTNDGVVWQKERDGREYYGKGKGKMVEENDHKWRRVAEKGNKNSINNRGTYRGDGEGSRQRMPRREDERGVTQEERSRGISGKATGQAGDQLVMRGPCVEEREEGELQCSEAKVGKDNKLVEIVQQDAPSLEFQEELAKTQATGAAVISDPMDTENGLQVVNSLIGNVNEVEDGGDTDRIMDMDEIRAVFLEHGVDMDAADLEECSEGEMAEALRELEQASGEDNREVEQVTNVEAEKDMADGDVGKKNGSRKRLFKPTISTAASTKMRLAKALVSPRKRAVGKTGTRHGEPGKQMENKGPSIPKLGPPKP
uniref:Uncharacterized protein n=1 Tax=Brassica campestris TaxID=3711 RepID=M4DCN3_BRACM